MTVSTVVDHNDYVGNGVTTSFPYTFRIFEKSDLVVTVIDLSENLTELVLDTDYTVTGAGGFSGGAVVLSSALANGWQISIARQLEATQETDFRNQGKFFAEVHEDAFDKLTMLIQQVGTMFSLALRKPTSIANWYDALNNYIRNLKDPRDPQDAATKNYVDVLTLSNLNRTLRTPDPINELPEADIRENKIIAFDSVGQPFVVLPPSGSASDVMIELAKPTGYSLIGEFDSVLSLRTTSGLNDLNLVSVKSFHIGKGIGGGHFRWFSSSVLADDGFSVIKPTAVTGSGRWVNVRKGQLTPVECGAIPDDVSFDSAIYLNYWASQSNCIGVKGSYYTSDSVTFSSSEAEINVSAKGMRIVVTVADKNGVVLPADLNKTYIIDGIESFCADGVKGTIRDLSDGFYISGARRVRLTNIRAEGWSNAGVWWFNVNRMEIDGFMGWRNDWDGTPLFASGGDLVEWTGTPGNAKSCLITNFGCYSDASQSISVNSLSAGRNIIVSDGHCFTYSSTEFTSKPAGQIKARHGMVIGYNSNQTYGGSIKISGVIIRDKGWTGVYRSGGSDGAVRYQPATISNVSIYDCGFGVNADNIGAGILFGDVVDGDMINNCYVENYANANNGAYKIQDSVGTGKITLANNVDKGCAGYGVHVTTESVNVLIVGHRSIEPASHGIFLAPMSGATLFRGITIDGARIERVTDGYGIYLANGVINANIKNVEIRGTTTNSTANVGILVSQNGQNVNIQNCQFYNFAYGIWYVTYVDTTTNLPWGFNQFFSTITAHRLARSTGTAQAKVLPSFYNGGVTNRFSNGGTGTSNGVEELLINGTPAT